MAYEALTEHCLELLAPVGVARARRMFGGQGLYLEGLFVGLIAFGRLYLKTNDETRPRFVAGGGEAFVYEARNKPVTVSAFWTPPADAMDSPALMAPWARLALQAALAARAASPQRKKGVLKPRAAPAAKRASAGRR